MIDPAPYRVEPGSTVSLADRPTDDDGGLDKDRARKATKKLVKRLRELQLRMWADRRHALLAVFQAMDAGGKDSTIRKVLGPVNPQGCRVTGFKVPTDLERRHDFLWRVHAAAPPAGCIGVFNRSHYEDVLVVRVHGLVPEARWRTRYDHINAFERLLHDEGTRIVKFHLHISPEYQLERFRRRLARPDRQWKFNPGDIEERARWHEYRRAYEDALGRCSTAHAPWYVVPAETRWFRDLLVATVLVQALEALDLQWPRLDYDPGAIEL